MYRIIRRAVTVMALKIIATTTSKRAIALAVAFILSAITTAASETGVTLEQPGDVPLEKMLGTIGMIGTMLIAVWTDTARPLDPRDENGRRKCPEEW
jgi:hypothetical protein|tara:strand:+ start:590 stop:880 length:291 start_codon:yes stop_codon:yes gene_type:complete